jgi:hypothetical protein
MIVEKRLHKRMDLDLDGHILYRGRHITATTRDITPYGALLSTDRLSVPTGIMLKLSLEIDGRHEIVSGLVVWCCQQKIGIMFKHAQFSLYTAAESLVSNQVLCGEESIEDTHASGMTPKHVLFQPGPGASI